MESWQVAAQLSVQGSFQGKLLQIPAEAPSQLLAAGKLGAGTLLGSKRKAMTHSWMRCCWWGARSPPRWWQNRKTWVCPRKVCPVLDTPPGGGGEGTSSCQESPEWLLGLLGQGWGSGQGPLLSVLPSLLTQQLLWEANPATTCVSLLIKPSESTQAAWEVKRNGELEW